MLNQEKIKEVINGCQGCRSLFNEIIRQTVTVITMTEVSKDAEDVTGPLYDIKWPRRDKTYTEQDTVLVFSALVVWIGQSFIVHLEQTTCNIIMNK